MNQLAAWYYDVEKCNHSGMRADKAFYWAERLAQLGYADGMLWLAHGYEYGYGTVKNLQKAAEYVIKAADMGHTEAIFILGISYEEIRRYGYLGDIASSYLQTARDRDYVWAKIALLDEGRGVYYGLVSEIGPVVAFLVTDDGIRSDNGIVRICGMSADAARFNQPTAYLDIHAGLFDIDEESQMEYYKYRQTHDQEFQNYGLKIVRYKYPFSEAFYVINPACRRKVVGIL